MATRRLPDSCLSGTPGPPLSHTRPEVPGASVFVVTLYSGQKPTYSPTGATGVVERRVKDVGRPVLPDPREGSLPNFPSSFC